ncbi:hypothetical protein IEQ_04945 [Bacillus cereus BAG6X1-2]|nr:hypothetical protein IEQ_04945 [Bacillus cereus BAG6X1-2]
MNKEHRKKNDYTLNIIYTLFLDSLDVRGTHIKMLRGSKRRGKTSYIVGFPGFYAKETKEERYFTFAGRRDSLLIPQRNIYNQICGFQCRIDNSEYVTVVKKL